MSRRLLILKFAPLDRDPRVLRQIEMFADDFEVTTCGYGPAPKGVQDHIRIPDGMRAWRPRRSAALALYLTRQYARLYFGAERIEFCQAELRNRPAFDAVIANDVVCLPLAVELRAPVLADLHEYAMGTGSGWTWKLFTRPFLGWAATHIPRCAAVTTVAPGIAERYEREFGGSVGVVPNSPNYRDDFKPSPTVEPIRLVHIGVGAPQRSLEISIAAVAQINQRRPGTLVFDLYVVPGVPEYIDGLRAQAGDAKVTGVQLCEPVEYSQLLAVTHRYDAGLFFAPPVTYNIKHALPNKFFEYVQARVGVIIGPSVEMAPYVDRYGFGAVASGWSVDDLVETLQQLTPGMVDGWKARADAAAWELSSEVTSRVWAHSVNDMVERGS